MLVWIFTLILVLITIAGWLFLKRDPRRYIHEQTSPMNIFFKWGRGWHHVFKIAVIILFMAAIFSLYKYLLSAAQNFSLAAAVIAGVVLAGGKELLDYKITMDDVVVSLLAIILGFLVIYFLL